MTAVASSVNGRIAGASPAVDRSTDTTAAGISWVEFSAVRRRMSDRWPTIWQLPVRSSMFADALARGCPAQSILDVGATDRVWEPLVRRLWPGVDYRSLDIERCRPHDYHEFAEVDRRFDLVLCFEVLEHLPPAETLQLLRQCVAACRPGGHVVVSVPNVYTPGVQLEFTHRTAIGPCDLPALLDWVGLDVIELSRIFLGSTRRRIMHQTLLAPLHRAIKVDYCRSIVALGRLPEREADRGPEDADG